MGHLTGARTKREITEVEVVSDDSLRVLKFHVNDKGVGISIRDATDDAYWSAKTFAMLSKEDAAIVATVLNGGAISTSYGSGTAALSRIEALSTEGHTIPKPEVPKDPTSSDCTALDIERAKAENLKEERQNIQLQLERDHALDRHVTGDVPGCPACDRKTVNPAGFQDHRTDRRPSTEDDLPF